MTNVREVYGVLIVVASLGELQASAKLTVLPCIEAIFDL